MALHRRRRPHLGGSESQDLNQTQQNLKASSTTFLVLILNGWAELEPLWHIVTIVTEVRAQPDLSLNKAEIVIFVVGCFFTVLFFQVPGLSEELLQKAGSLGVQRFCFDVRSMEWGMLEWGIMGVHWNLWKWKILEKLFTVMDPSLLRRCLIDLIAICPMYEMKFHDVLCMYFLQWRSSRFGSVSEVWWLFGRKDRRSHEALPDQCSSSWRLTTSAKDTRARSSWWSKEVAAVCNFRFWLKSPAAVEESWYRTKGGKLSHGFSEHDLIRKCQSGFSDKTACFHH